MRVALSHNLRLLGLFSKHKTLLINAKYKKTLLTKEMVSNFLLQTNNFQSQYIQKMVFFQDQQERELGV
jgi:hypothetical protein